MDRRSFYRSRNKLLTLVLAFVIARAFRMKSTSKFIPDISYSMVANNKNTFSLIISFTATPALTTHKICPNGQKKIMSAFENEIAYSYLLPSSVYILFAFFPPDIHFA